MSSMAFGTLTRKRQEADENESTKKGHSPGFRTYVDTLAALVPAEVLAAHAAILTFTTETREGPGDTKTTTITEPGTLKFAFWALCILSVMFYVAGFQKKRVSVQAFFGALIPPLAFIGWTMAQRATAFDAVWPDTGEATRNAIVVLGALVLGLYAAALPFSTNKSRKKDDGDSQEDDCSASSRDRVETVRIDSE